MGLCLGKIFFKISYHRCKSEYYHCPDENLSYDVCPVLLIEMSYADEDSDDSS